MITNVDEAVEHDRDAAASLTEPCNGVDPEGGGCWRIATEECPQCGGKFCEEHADPEDHDCTGERE